MTVARDEVLRIAELAKLHFTDAELHGFTIQFRRILDYIEKLREVEVEGIEPTSHVLAAGGAEQQVLREDEPGASLTSEQALANAPDKSRGHFGVPRMIG